MKTTSPDSTSHQGIDTLLEQSLLDIGIPPCPAILDRITAEMRKDEPDYNRLASIIMADVGLSASLVKTANSPYFGVRRLVRSVNEALMILGLNISQRAIAGIILRQTFPDSPSLVRFWDASARIARLAGWVAQRVDIRGLTSEDAYTFGLFRDCGIPVLLSRFPEYEQTLTKANQELQLPFTAIEEAGLPTNHAMVGCVLAQSWWLPEEICQAIRNHHDLNILESAESQLPMQSRRLIAAAQLAEHLLQHLLGLSLTQEWSKLGNACLRLLNIEEAELEALYNEARPIAEESE